MLARSSGRVLKLKRDNIPFQKITGVQKAEYSVSKMEVDKSSLAVCWLRNDLRYHDNEVLLKAHQEATMVMPIYCFDPRHFKGTYHHNFPKTAHHRSRFIAQSVQDLRNILRTKGSDLVVQWGKPEEVIPKVLMSLHVTPPSTPTKVIYQEEVTKEEKDVEAGVREACTKLGATLHSIWGATLYHKDDLLFPVSQLPNTYTAFRKSVEGKCRVRPPLSMPNTLKPLPPGCIPGTLPTPSDLQVPDTPVDKRTAFPFSGGESQALKRVKEYFWDTDCVAKYKETRNGLLGDKYSTKFSPWLSLGCLSPRYVYSEVKRYEKERTANQSTYWVIFELLWRDYFRFVCARFGDRVFYPSGIMGKKVKWHKDPLKFKAWQEGRTGVPFVDANMRELRETGWMSNRGRQNVASFLIKDLGLDWRLGAEWFESQLLDHDVCSNYGNWNYSAGIGNDPRENRKFNMIKQAMDYDCQGDYVRVWVPELKDLSGSAIHTPWRIPSTSLSRVGISLGDTYPNPLLIDPSWSRDHKTGPNSNKRGAGRNPNYAGRGQQRGIDFYFKPSQKH